MRVPYIDHAFVFYFIGFLPSFVLSLGIISWRWCPFVTLVTFFFFFFVYILCPPPSPPKTKRVIFTMSAEAFVGGTWGTVSSVAVVFEASASAGSSAGATSTAVTVNWLVVGNELSL